MTPSTAIPEINSPMLKASAAIAGAVGANTDAAENVALSVATTLMSPTVADPWLFWFFVAIPWGGIASFLAAFYSAMVAGEWLWKKVFKKLAVRFGWIKPTPRRVFTKREIELHMASLDSDHIPLP